MKQKAVALILYLLSDVRKLNVPAFHIGSAETIVIVMSGLFFLILIGGIILVFLKINSKK
jgi:hypothetical protein